MEVIIDRQITHLNSLTLSYTIIGANQNTPHPTRPRGRPRSARARGWTPAPPANLTDRPAAPPRSCQIGSKPDAGGSHNSSRGPLDGPGADPDTAARRLQFAGEPHP